MGKHGKNSNDPITNLPARITDDTRTIAEIQETMKGVRVIDTSIERHPIPPATVTE